MLDNSFLGLPFGVRSEDGKLYVVDLWRPNLNDLEEVWNKYSKYRVIFSDIVLGNYNHFFDLVMQASTIVLEVMHNKKQVGLLYGTEIRPLTSALAHYVFFDRNTNGRQRLILASLKWVMEELDLHKVNISTPIYAFAALHRIHKLGLRIEGRRKEAILYEGSWRDILEFGLTRDELTEEVLQNAALPRTEGEQRWHGLINNDPILMRKILRVKNGRSESGNSRSTEQRIETHQNSAGFGSDSTVQSSSTEWNSSGISESAAVQ